MAKDKPYRSVHKFGYNADVDTASVPEDVWDAGGLYAFAAAAAKTIVYSDSASDNGTGTGAHGLVIEGLDAIWHELPESIPLTVTTTVTASNSFLRVFRAYVTSSGATLTNEGQISIEINDVESARISSAQGQTLMSIYTVPDLEERDDAYLEGWSAFLPTTGGANAADVRLVMKPDGGSWRVQDRGAMDENNRRINVVYPEPIQIPEKSDWRVEVLDVSSNDTVVGATMDFYYTTEYHHLR